VVTASRCAVLSVITGGGKWVELFCRTRDAALKAALNALVPDDAKEAAGHGRKAKRSNGDRILEAIAQKATCRKRKLRLLHGKIEEDQHERDPNRFRQ
jgi:hypothetical protein